MAISKIYRGGYQDNHPEQLEFPMAAASAGLQPGAMVQVVDGELVVATSTGVDDSNEILVLNAPPCFGVDYEYSAGETGYAYVRKSGQVFAVRAAVGVIGGVGTRLTADGGEVDLATLDPVIGYLASPVTVAATAGQLIDMRTP